MLYFRKSGGNIAILFVISITTVMSMFFVIVSGIAALSSDLHIKRIERQELYRVSDLCTMYEIQKIAFDSQYEPHGIFREISDFKCFSEYESWANTGNRILGVTTDGPHSTLHQSITFTFEKNVPKVLESTQFFIKN